MTQPLIAKITFIIALFLLPGTSFAQKAGTLDFDPGANRYKFYNGSHWISMGAPILLTSCGPGQKSGIQYDTLLNTLKYCNGSVWMTMFGLPTLSLCTKKGAWRYNKGVNRPEFCNGALWVLMS